MRGDLLTGYNGNTVTSDTIGNILSDGTRTYTWKHGRQLATTAMGGKTWTYTYNAEGMRTKRVSGNEAYTYYYNGDLLRYVDYDSNTTDSNQAAKLYFVLDANGNPIEVSYRPEGSTATKFYYYVQNLQGDVIALVDSANGNTVVTYTYDAWGNVLSTNGSLATTLGVLNPFRYRGYVYDSETALYYCQSRYYDPAMGRFISADAFVSTGKEPLDNNMFTYCGNNPVMGYDPTGNWDWGTFAEGASLMSIGVTAIIAAAVVASGGACIPLLVAAGATFVAGGMTLVNGVAEVVESTTGYNYMRDGVYNGNEGFYEGQKAIFETVAETGAIALSATSSSPALCFVAGTVILTANEAKKIEDIHAGDYVWAWDEETGDVALKEVVETYINETDELVHVFVNGEEIISTPSHPFYSPIKGWTDAVQLRAGDILVLVNGEYVVVEKVQHEILEAPVTVYNFQVEDYHTYYVANGVLVHNDCPQRLVAGKKSGWNARVSDGGLQDHAPPHAHIFFKDEKLASVDANGNVLKGLKKLGRKGLAFANDNLEQISEGIKKWWG